MCHIAQPYSIYKHHLVHVSIYISLYLLHFLSWCQSHADIQKRSQYNIFFLTNDLIISATIHIHCYKVVMVLVFPTVGEFLVFKALILQKQISKHVSEQLTKVRDFCKH